MHEMAVAARVIGHVGAFNDAVASGDWARFAARFTPDATMVFPDLPVPVAHGRDAIRAAYDASPPTDRMLALGATTDEDTDHVEFEWSDGGTGQMWITWQDDLVAALEVRFG